MASENTLVRVKQGQLRGVVDENVYGECYLAFRGIPFAKPPVGPLRFKDPEPAEPWAGIRDASKYGDMCAQIDLMARQPKGSDDCLYLNVFRPVNESPAKRAVMVWIHGGAFIHGSGDKLFYGPDYLVRKDIVLVTINYRVGVLGFLNLEHELAPGNQGLKDQVMALKWVQENISSFGGDPNNVTIFGESAGGASIHYLTISPLAQGLFHKAIAQSGVAVNPWALQTKEPRKFVLQLAAKLGEHSTDPKTVLEFLRTVDVEKLILADSELITPQERHIMFGVFVPGIDDKSPNPFLPKHPSLLMQQGIKVPCIIGYNSDEGSFFLTPFNGPNSEESQRKINEDFSVVVPWETMKRLRKEELSPMDLKRLYFGDESVSPKTMQLYSDYFSDTMFLQGIHEVVNVQMEKSSKPTYFYQFSFTTEDSPLKQLFNIPPTKTTHGEDIMYLFYPHWGVGILSPYEKGTDKYTIMEYFTEMWTNFAKTGNPTPTTTELIRTIWKPIQKSDRYDYLNINLNLRMECYKKEGQRFDWKRIKNKL